MGVNMAPLDDSMNPVEYLSRPPPYMKEIPKIRKPTMDDTECNYVVLFFVGGVFLMMILDNFRR